jgi:sec-independent protein translocase protein TatB
MMPGLDFSEVIIVIVLALLVLGPKDLPLMMRKLGRFMAKMRGMAAEFRSGFDELARQAELDELRREVDALRHSTRSGLAAMSDEFAKPIAEAREAAMTPLPAPEAKPDPAPDAKPATFDVETVDPTPYDPEPSAISPAHTAGGAR